MLEKRWIMQKIELELSQEHIEMLDGLCERFGKDRSGMVELALTFLANTAMVIDEMFKGLAEAEAEGGDGEGSGR